MIPKKQYTHHILLILILTVSCVSVVSLYSHYPHYPKYCSRSSEMHTRSIPSLNSSRYPNTQLLQVTTIIRHGSRTPLNNKKCWDEGKAYNKEDASSSPPTFSWDCSLKTVLGQPIHKDNLYSESPKFLYDKQYDAFEKNVQLDEEEHHNKNKPVPKFHLKPPFLSNFLNGTCELGQLLQEGYDQHIKNGKILRIGYMPSPRNAERQNLNLFLNLRLDETYTEPYIYFRSDDMPRTVMSGQVLLQSLFGTSMSSSTSTTTISGIYPRIVVHTGDFTTDVLIPNPDICPKLNDILIDAKNSQAYQQYAALKDAKTQKIMKIWKDIDGNEKNIMDCLMTTICTDRELPDVINDFDGVEVNGSSVFSELMNIDTWQWSYQFRFNNAQYSKLAMGPLWAEIMDKIELTKSRTNIKPQIGDDDNVPRLVVFSGHDDTIMPLLATLGPHFLEHMEWTPYASMLLIEVHGVLEKNEIVKRVFRLLYNGKVITHHVQGCSQTDQLCDLNILLLLVQPFATRDRNCNSIVKITPLTKRTSSHKSTTTSSTTPTPPTILGFFILSIMCSLVGGLFTYLYMTFIVVDMNVQYGSANLNESDTNINGEIISSSVGAASVRNKKHVEIYELTDTFEDHSIDDSSSRSRTTPEVHFI